MILPHELFAAIYHCHKQVWVHRICPSGERLAQFWDAVKDGAGDCGGASATLVFWTVSMVVDSTDASGQSFF